MFFLAHKPWVVSFRNALVELREPQTQPYPKCEVCGRDWHGLANAVCLTRFDAGLTNE